MQSCRLRAGSSSRFLAAILSVAGTLAGSQDAFAQPGALYAMTPYQKCRNEMIQTQDLNGDGKRDFICIRDDAPGGISTLSGVKDASGRLPVLATNAVAGLGGNVASIRVRISVPVPGQYDYTQKFFVACHNTGSTLLRFFRTTDLVQVGTYDLGYACSALSVIDITNDGDDELLVSSSAHSRVDALRPLGTIGGGNVSAQSLFAYSRPETPSFGSSITTVGDVNGDGLTDWAVGAPAAGTNRGMVMVMQGNSAGTVPLQFLHGLAPAGQFGRDLLFADLTGDGARELLVGSPGDGAIHILNLNSGAFQFGQEIRRQAGDGLGALLSRNVLDVNGDNVPDLAATYNGGTTIISGRSLQAIRDLVGFYRRPELIVKEAHHEPNQVYGGVVVGMYTSLPGSNNNSDLFHVFVGDNWGCPTLNVALAHSPSEYAGVFGNDGQVPSITVPGGCAVPGGDIVIQSDMSPDAPAVILAGPQMSSSPFPSIANSANKLVVKRDSIEALEPIFAPLSGIATVVMRDIQPTLTDPDGAGPIPQELRWFIQAIQFGQFAPTAQASGKGIASSMGYQLRAVQ